MNTQYSKKHIEIPDFVGRSLSCKKCISTWKLIFHINKCIFKESLKNTKKKKETQGVGLKHVCFKCLPFAMSRYKLLYIKDKKGPTL